jgi:hypothetical protein
MLHTVQQIICVSTNNALPTLQQLSIIITYAEQKLAVQYKFLQQNLLGGVRTQSFSTHVCGQLV